MKAIFVSFVFVLVFSLAKPATAADDGKDAAKSTEPVKSVDDVLSELVKLGPGVFKVKTDEQGRVTSLVVVGQSSVSTVLGAAKGREIARQKARLSADAEFVKWMKQRVQIRETTTNETTIILVNTQGANAAPQEAGKSIDKTSSAYATAAQGLIRGMSLLHVEVSDTDKTCTLVFGWSQARSRAAKQLAGSDTGTNGDGNVRNGSNQATIRPEKSTSDDAGDFLK